MEEVKYDNGKVERRFLTGRKAEIEAALQESWARAMANPRVTEIRHVKIGRNDFCPCGSGKKFKKCCLHKAERV